MNRRPLLIAITGVFAACGGGGAVVDDGGFPAAPFQSVTSQDGVYQIAVFSLPQPPIRAVCKFKYEITFSDGGAPASGLDLTVVPFMPQMNHGTSVAPTTQELGGGGYEIDDVYLFMAGEFQLRSALTGPVPDNASPTFTVN